MDVIAYESEKLFQDGLEMYKKQLYSEALKRWKAVFQINSDYPNIAMYINVCERQEVQTLTALENSEMLLEEVANLDQTQLVDSVAETRQEFEKHFGAGKSDQAGYCLELLLRERPSDPEAMVFLIQAFQRLRNTSRTRDCALRLVSLQPYLARSHYMLGSVLFKLHKFRKARESFARALRLRPDNFRILYHLGMTQMALRDPLSAEDYFLRADKIDPGNSRVRAALDRLKSEKIDLENSASEASQILEGEGVYADQLYRSANIYVSCHKLEKAFECLGRAIELNAEYKDALYLKGKLELEIGQYAKSYESLTKTMQLMDSVPRGYDNVIQFEKSGYLEEAASELLRILKLEPDYGSIHVELGKSYVNAQQYERALEELDKGLILSPQYPDGHFHRGLCLMHLDDIEGALDSFNVALELNPGYSEVSFTMAELLAKQNRVKEALQVLNRCKSILDSDSKDFEACQSLSKRIKAIKTE